MKIYRWYSEEFGMGGFTVAKNEATKTDVITEVYNYIVDTFSDMESAPKNIEDLLISVWAIEDDDDFNELYPNTIAAHY